MEYEKGQFLRILVYDAVKKRTLTYIGEFQSQDQHFVSIKDRMVGNLSLNKSTISLISDKGTNGQPLSR